MAETPSSGTVSTRCRRIATLAGQAPQMTFTTLAHHIDLEWLGQAHRRTRKDGAAGVDGRTAAAYGRDLQANLQSLLNRAKSGTYRAPPVRRVHIAKGDGGRTRPIGIPTFEDKVLQRAVVMVLEAVYEQDFLDCSYGFRPGRSAHQALEALWKGMMSMGGGWVLDVDIRSFFDTLDHGHLRALVGRRVRDGVLVRLIGKWLKAGVMEDGQCRRVTMGTPQGGVISPLLANVYLHYVLDAWFQRQVRPRLGGRALLVRYADDFVMCFAREDDARRVLAVLPRRLGRYGLALHPDKTHLVAFHPPGRNGDRKDPPSGGSDRTFDLLGLTHYWARSRTGRWVVKRKTAAGRFRRAVARVNGWLGVHYHCPVRQQHAYLCRALRGHFGYYGITGNSRALSALRDVVRRLWRKWLCRRRRRGDLRWDRYASLLRHYPLPRPVPIHSVYVRSRARP